MAHHKAGRLGEAKAAYREILRSEPDNSNAQHLLGVVHHQLGDSEGAIELFDRAIAGNPRKAAYHNSLGEAQGALDRWQDALASYRRAIDIDPTRIDARLNVVKALHRLGRTEDAIDCARQVVAEHSTNEMAHFNLAILQLERGAVAEAVESYRRAVEIKPDFAKAHLHLGNALKDAESTPEAIAAYRQALEADPTLVPALTMLGRLLCDNGEFADSARCYRRALAIEPGLATAHNNLGHVLKEQGDVEGAIACYRSAIANDRKLAAGHANLGSALGAVGRKAPAIQSHRRALAIDPELTEVWWHLSTINKIESAADEDFLAMKRRSEDTTLSDAQITYLGFALARAYDDLGNYDESFRWLAKANGLKRATIDVDLAAVERLFDRMVRAFPVGRLRACDGGSESDLPIFIVGMPRSGTTLVEQILASHPQVYGAGELGDLRRVIERAYGPDNIPETMAELTDAGWQRLGETYLEAIRQRSPQARHITDKMPGNYRFIGAIARALPKARIIHCRRDPIATCFSCFRTLFSGRQDFAYDLEDIGAYYRLYEKLMAHWHAVLPGRVLDVDYEALVTDQMGETRRLLAHCGLQWDDACLAFHEAERPVVTASAAQVRRPLYTSSLAHWRNYAAMLKPLQAALGRPNNPQ